MTVFENSDYRIFLKRYIEMQPNNGRGLLAKMAVHLNVHSTLMSLILSGKREISPEQACDLIEFLDLTDDESDYFMLLVDLERAGTVKLKKRIQQQLKKLKENHSAVGARLQTKSVLSEKDQAQFYSHWIYSAIRLYCTIGESGKSLEEVAEYFRLSRSKAISILQFLNSVGLVKQTKNRYVMGEQKTYIGPNSPFLLKHHANWRLKSLQKIGEISGQELMVTSPFSVSRKDFARIREMLLDFIAESSKVIQKSDSEELACFNLDLFLLSDSKSLKGNADE